MISIQFFFLFRQKLWEIFYGADDENINSEGKGAEWSNELVFSIKKLSTKARRKEEKNVYTSLAFCKLYSWEME